MTRALSDHARGQVEAVAQLLAADVEAPAIRAALAQLVTDNGNGATPAASPTTWTPLDLTDTVAGIASGEIIGPVPALLTRTDGLPLIYPGEVHSIAGEPEAGKGWIMLAETARLLTAAQGVLYLDFEDGPVSVIARLLALGVEPAAIVQHFRYVRPEAAPTDAEIRQLADLGCALVIIDGLSEAYSLLGLDYGSNIDVPEFLRRLARPLTANGAAVVQIDHVPKDKTNRGRYAIGGQHKLAGVAVAYGIEVIDRPSRTTTGRVKLVLAKDRHGHVPGGHGATVALVTITPAAEAGAHLTVTIDPPDGQDEHGEFRPTRLMDKVSRYVEDNPGASLRSIREGVTGKDTAKDLALDLLVSEGWITLEITPRAKRHTSARAYRETDDPHTVAHRGPATHGPHGEQTVAPWPSPTGEATHPATPPEEPTRLGPYDDWTQEATT